jgi:hypothetical protein
VKTTRQDSFWRVATKPDDTEPYSFLLRLGCLGSPWAIPSAGLVAGKSLVIIEISALRASALAIFSVKWFKIEVRQQNKRLTPIPNIPTANFGASSAQIIPQIIPRKTKNESCFQSFTQRIGSVSFRTG